MLRVAIAYRSSIAVQITLRDLILKGPRGVKDEVFRAAGPNSEPRTDANTEKTKPEPQQARDAAVIRQERLEAVVGAILVAAV